MSGLPLESAIYSGFVRHRRFTPRHHEFSYPLFMLLLKLDELPELFERFWQMGSGRVHWARFKREDYIGDPELSAAAAVRQKIAQLLGQPADSVDGDVFLLGQMRYLGVYFSPLNLYFLKQQQGFRYMLAEVSNTPWNQRHYYLIDLADIRPHDKAFHVSPFNPMEQRYHWQIIPPDASRKKSLVHIELHGAETAAQKVFDATMLLKRAPLNQKQLNRVLIKTPVQTASIVAAIHWQALKLLFKRVPLYPHPEKGRTEQRKRIV